VSAAGHAKGDRVVLGAALLTSLHSKRMDAGKGTVLAVRESRSEKYPGIVARYYRVETDSGLVVQLAAEDYLTGELVDWADPGPDQPQEMTVVWGRSYRR
jgi:hypothetical protein